MTMRSGGAGHLEALRVGRKTPRDGKLEISSRTAERLRTLGSRLAVILYRGDDPRPARLEAGLIAMACTCDKGQAAGQHHHHFLESPHFRDLSPGAAAELSLASDREVELRVHPVAEHPPPSA